MRLLLAAIAIVWVLLLPPLFTSGACTAEFEAASAMVESNKRLLASSSLATQYFQAKAIPAAAISASDCSRTKPRFLERCGSGPLVYAVIPVNNKICSVYRDDAVRIQLHYDERDRLTQIVSEMKPYKSLPLPWGGFIHWAR